MASNEHGNSLFAATRHFSTRPLIVTLSRSKPKATRYSCQHSSRSYPFFPWLLPNRERSGSTATYQPFALERRVSLANQCTGIFQTFPIFKKNFPPRDQRNPKCTNIQINSTVCSYFRFERSLRGFNLTRERIERKGLKKSVVCLTGIGCLLPVTNSDICKLSSSIGVGWLYREITSTMINVGIFLFFTLGSNKYRGRPQVWKIAGRRVRKNLLVATSKKTIIEQNYL